MPIRPATPDDLDTLTRLRTEFLAEVRGRPADGPDTRVAADNRAFFARTMVDGSVGSWVAEEDGAVVGIASGVVHDAPPLPEDPRTREGTVINLYVRPPARGRGIGRALLEACLASAPDHGIRRFSLYATDAGRPVYERSGFTTDPRWMTLRVPPA